MSEPGKGFFDQACYRCGAKEDLLPDEHLEELWICRPCLERVVAQNELIRRGIEGEPDVEM